METELYLDTLGAAGYLKLSHRTLESWRQRGIGPAYLKIGGLVRYTTVDLDSWLESIRVVPEAEKAAGG